MNWTLIVVYSIVAIVVLFIIKKFIKGLFKIVLILIIAVAIYGVATGALTSSASPKDFINKSIDSSRSKVIEEAGKVKNSSKDNLKGAASGLVN